MDKLETKITTESFSEAGGKEVYPGLEIIEPVLAIMMDLDLNPHETYRGRLHRVLDDQARELKATHVFDVKYEFTNGPLYDDAPVKAIGTAYGPTIPPLSEVIAARKEQDKKED